MPCTSHPDRDEVTACSVCGQALCKECLFYANSDPYCHSCVSMLEREHAETQKKRARRTILSAPVGIVIAVAAVAGWRWVMLQTAFGMALFTPIVMIGIILGVGWILVRMAGARSLILFGVGIVLAVGVMLGGEYIMYDYKLYSAAQQGLSAEKLLRYAEQNTFEMHLKGLGILDYPYFLFGIFLVWRRLWPVKSDELVVVRPAELEQSG